MFDAIRNALAPARPVLCPYCCKVLPRELDKTHSFYCARLQSRASTDQIEYVHNIQPGFLRADWDSASDFPVSPSYLEAARASQARFVSVLGLKTAGKTTWLQGIGALTLLPNEGHRHCYPFLPCLLRNAAAAQGDPAIYDSQSLGLGELPKSTDKEGRTPTYILEALGNKELRHLVLKDIAGETYEKKDYTKIFTVQDRRHIIESDWHLFILNGGSENELTVSISDAMSWMRAIHPKVLAERRRRPPRALVMFAQCDARDTPKRLAQAVRMRPNRVHTDDQTPTMADYMAGMREVDVLTRAELKERSPELFERLSNSKNFTSLHVGACSVLGAPPVRPANGNSPYEAACVTQPALVRVLDPVLWMLHDEKLI